MLSTFVRESAIKENVKGTLCHYVQRHWIASLIFVSIVFFIAIYTRYDSDELVPTETATMNEFAVDDTIPLLQIASDPSENQIVGQQVSIDELKRQRRNPLELEQEAVRESNQHIDESDGPLFRASQGESIGVEHSLNLSVPLNEAPYFRPINLNLNANELYIDYQRRTMDKIRSVSNRTCQYVNVHGASFFSLICLHFGIIGKWHLQNKQDFHKAVQNSFNVYLCIPSSKYDDIHHPMWFLCKAPSGWRIYYKS